MNVERMSEFYDYVYSTPPNSLERITRLNELSDTDRSDLYDFEMGVLSGRITRPKNNNHQEGTSMVYEVFKEKMDNCIEGTMLELSKFAKEEPELYGSYRQRYQQERDRAQRLHNQSLIENKFKNKPHSIR